MFGLAAWFDASAITGLNDGDGVVIWTDLSGNLNHASQVTAENRPTYQTNELNGKPVVRFDGVDDRFVLSAAIPVSSSGLNYDGLGDEDYDGLGDDAYDTLVSEPTTGVTIYAVVKLTGSGVRTLVCGDSNSLQLAFQAEHRTNLRQAGGASILVGATELSTFRQVNLSHDGTTAILRQSGIADGSIGNGTSFDPLKYIGRNHTPGEFFTIDLAELLVFTVAHDLATKLAIEDYLRRKWDLMQAQTVVNDWSLPPCENPRRRGPQQPGGVLPLM
jgi:hypothetical protein